MPTAGINVRITHLPLAPNISRASEGPESTAHKGLMILIKSSLRSLDHLLTVIFDQ
jgi:hypothetical protein